MHLLYLITVWIHILAAMVWIGGSAYIALVLVPVVRRSPSRQTAAQLLRAGALRFRTVGWVSLGLLVLTGCLNLAFRGYGIHACLSGAIFAGAFGKTLGLKLILVAVLLTVSAVHDFYLGPKAGAILLSSPDSPKAQRARRVAAWMGRTVLLLGLAIVAAAVVLVRGGF